MAKTKNATKRKSEKHEAPFHPDAPLILSCIEYARALRGASGAFEVDPTGDHNFAEAIDGKALTLASKAANAAANYLPSTFDGLRAKASAALVGMELDREDIQAVLKSLCGDVERFHKAMSAADATATTVEIAL